MILTLTSVNDKLFWLNTTHLIMMYESDDEGGKACLVLSNDSTIMVKERPAEIHLSIINHIPKEYDK